MYVIVVMTSSPSNEAELQLYRVMQRASLLAYYDTLLEMGKNRKCSVLKIFLQIGTLINTTQYK